MFAVKQTLFLKMWMQQIESPHVTFDEAAVDTSLLSKFKLGFPKCQHWHSNQSTQHLEFQGVSAFISTFSIKVHFNRICTHL